MCKCCYKYRRWQWKKWWRDHSAFGIRDLQITIPQIMCMVRISLFNCLDRKGVKCMLPASDKGHSWHIDYLSVILSGVATRLARGGQSATPDSEKLQKIGKKSEKIGKKVEKSGRKDKNREGSFTLPLLTDRAGYATGYTLVTGESIYVCEVIECVLGCGGGGGGVGMFMGCMCFHSGVCL